MNFRKILPKRGINFEKKFMKFNEFWEIIERYSYQRNFTKIFEKFYKSSTKKLKILQEKFRSNTKKSLL